MDRRIVNALEAKGRLTTRELAISIGEDRDVVYRRCKRLERDECLRSERLDPHSKIIYFFTLTGEPLTTDSFERINRMRDEIIEFVRRFSLPQEQRALVAGLEMTLERLAGLVPPNKRGAFEVSASRLLEVAETAQKSSDVTSLVATPPMNPPELAWELGPQTALL